MKKLTISLAIILGMAMTGFAQDGGMFHRADNAKNGSDGYALYESKGDSKLGGLPGVPGHGESGDGDAPLGTGIAMLTALGAAYLVGKKRREE